MLLFFLSSGLFLGWSLGANNTANIFGTAVATRMVKFQTAAIITSVLVVIGAVVSGAGATHTLGELGAVNRLEGSFMVALAAALTVSWMTKAGLPVSTSQAIVGAIIAWNFYSGTRTNVNTLYKIVFTWVINPLLAGVFSAFLYILFRQITQRVKIHLFRLDAYTRTGLILVGAFGAYSLGANNIANVMGVFVPVAPFRPLHIQHLFTISGTQQLFLIGGLAIAVGVMTYSRRVMYTVGKELVHITPQMALVVVLAQALVMFLFTSESLHSWLTSHNLPAFPLVPVSSSQGIVGAVIGIGAVRNIRNVRVRVLLKIASGWLSTPIVAGLIAFVSLFFLQNVFDMQVYRPIKYIVDAEARAYLQRHHIVLPWDKLEPEYPNEKAFDDALHRLTILNAQQRDTARYAAVVDPLRVGNLEDLKARIAPWLSTEQWEALKSLEGKTYRHPWRFYEDLARQTPAWNPELMSEAQARETRRKQAYLARFFRIPIKERKKF